jgi:hypothetical protein
MYENKKKKLKTNSEGKKGQIIAEWLIYKFNYRACVTKELEFGSERVSSSMNLFTGRTLVIVLLSDWL